MLRRLVVNGAWRIAAVRSLTMPAIHYEMLDSMTAMAQRGSLPDSLRSLLLRMRLAVASDSELKQHFTQHEAGFQQLADRFQSENNLLALDVDQHYDGAFSDSMSRSALLTSMRHLGIGALTREPSHPQCEFLRIGNTQRGDLGYIFAVDACRIPVATLDDEFTYVEQITPMWYVYKRIN